MKTNLSIIKWLTVLAFLIVGLQLSTVFGQGTAFTYQGRLQANGSPANGTYNLTFSLFNTNTSGVPIAGLVTNNGVIVSNGLFTVLIDFGPGVFTGGSNWLEIAVETNGAGAFTTLAPRQQLTPTPYAIEAESAGGLSGTLSASQLDSIGNSNGGGGNFFVGTSGNSTTSGSYNTANGLEALYFNTSGSDNTANGFQALVFNTSGSDNTASGYEALLYNKGGSYNTANGYQALAYNVSGFGNTANGVWALTANTTGTYNTANGYDALYSNTNGSWNTAEGISALQQNTSGSYNIGLGYNAGLNITTGSSNVDIGNPGVAGDTNVIRIGSGQTQTFIAGVINGNGGGLSNLNVNAAQLASIGNTNGGAGNFFVGPAGNSTTSGYYNTAIGLNALVADTSGYWNTASGYTALFSNTTGAENTADGAYALHFNTSGSYNTAEGVEALYFNTSGIDNVANGNSTLGFNTSGAFNTADGAAALQYNTNGSYNTALGCTALYNNNSGSNNIALGYLAGFYITNGSFNIDIGNFGQGSDTNIMRIGSGQTQTFIAGVINGNGAGLSNLNAAQLTSVGNTNGGIANFFLGSSGNSTTSGYDNTADGVYALDSNTSGSDNTANGYSALDSNTSGSDNTADGAFALYSIRAAVTTQPMEGGHFQPTRAALGTSRWVWEPDLTS